jgi:hypothetical protein
MFRKDAGVGNVGSSNSPMPTPNMTQRNSTFPSGLAFVPRVEPSPFSQSLT